MSKYSSSSGRSLTCSKMKASNYPLFPRGISSCPSRQIASAARREHRDLKHCGSMCPRHERQVRNRSGEAGSRSGRLSDDSRNNVLFLDEIRANSWLSIDGETRPPGLALAITRRGELKRSSYEEKGYLCIRGKKSCAELRP